MATLLPPAAERIHWRARGRFEKVNIADHPSRREFLKSGLSTALMFSAARNALAAEPKNAMPYRKLGRTGESVSLIGIGGSHLGQKPTEDEAIRIVRTAIDHGINFLDNCWDYNDGRSEIREGKALRVQRLQTDHVDLLQFHEIIRPDDPDKVFAPGGSFEAMMEAQKAGKVRYVGFTGHKSPDFHLHMLEVARKNGFHFDTVQMPLNVMDAHYESFARKVVPVAIQEEIGVLGMKPLGAGKIMESKSVEAIDCLHYAMNLPTSVVITGCDSLAVLEQALQAARTFEPLSEAEITALLATTAPFATEGKYEGYKMTHEYDSTIQHPEFLG